MYCKIWEEENAKDIEWGFFNYDPCDSVIYEDLKTPGTEIDRPNDLVEAQRNPCTNEQAKALLQKQFPEASRVEVANVYYFYEMACNVPDNVKPILDPVHAVNSEKSLIKARKELQNKLASQA